MLVEGVSIRGISRLTELDKETILSLLLTAGSRCADLFDALVRNVPTTCGQADELWTFVQKKQKRLTPDDPDERGDQYIWIALDAENKLVVTHYVGKRTAQSARAFMADLGTRLRFRPQIATDGPDWFRPSSRSLRPTITSAASIRHSASRQRCKPD